MVFLLVQVVVLVSCFVLSGVHKKDGIQGWSLDENKCPTPIDCRYV